MKVISRLSHTPIYQQICDLIREEIASRKLAPGSQILSEHEIMASFNVSRNSAQKAIEVLVNEGRVVRIQGKGTFVTSNRVPFGLQNLISFSEETRNKGYKPASKVIDFKKIPADIFVSRKLVLKRNDQVYRLERLRMADNHPISHQISYVPERLCPDLDQFDFRRESLYEIIENFYHLPLSWQDMIIKPVIADETTASWLNVTPTTPLLLTESTAYLEDSTPVELSLHTYLSDRYEFSVRSFRKGVTSLWRGIKET